MSTFKNQILFKSSCSISLEKSDLVSLDHSLPIHCVWQRAAALWARLTAAGFVTSVPESVSWVCCDKVPPRRWLQRAEMDPRVALGPEVKDQQGPIPSRGSRENPSLTLLGPGGSTCSGLVAAGSGLSLQLQVAFSPRLSLCLSLRGTLGIGRRAHLITQDVSSLGP